MPYFENLGQALAATDKPLKMACKGCGHTASWTGKQALLVFSEWAPPYEVRERLKCGQCGEKTRISVTL